MPTRHTPEERNAAHDCVDFKRGPDFYTRRRMVWILILMLMICALLGWIIYADVWSGFLESMGVNPLRRTSIYSTD